MPSMFKQSNVKIAAEKRPAATFLIGSFIISQVYLLSSLAISDGRKHPGFVTYKAVATVIGIFIWLDGLKSGAFGDTVLRYIGFLIIASFLQFFMWIGSYGESELERVNSKLDTPLMRSVTTN